MGVRFLPLLSSLGGPLLASDARAAEGDAWVAAVLSGVVLGRTRVAELPTLLGAPLQEYPHAPGIVMHRYGGGDLPGGVKVERYFLSKGDVVVGVRVAPVGGEESMPGLARFRAALERTSTTIPLPGGMAIHYVCAVEGLPEVGVAAVWAPNGMLAELSLGPVSGWTFSGHTCASQSGGAALPAVR